MCGRYVVAYVPQTLVSGFSVTRVVPFPRRWNVTPQSPVPVVYETREGERVAELMRWGLVPHWAKDPAIGLKLNNARAETVAEKPSFKSGFERHRCLIPANGFYEWQSVRQHLLAVMQSASRRDALGKNGRQRVLAHYTQKQVAEQTTAVYREMLAAH